MAQQEINTGSGPNAGDGDPLRTAFTKTNDNFTELYAADATLTAADATLTAADAALSARLDTIEDPIGAPENSWLSGKGPAIVSRSVPRFLTPEMYIGAETQIVYAPVQGDPSTYTGCTDFKTAFDAMYAELAALGATSQWPSYTMLPAGIAFLPGHRYLTSGSLPLHSLVSNGFLVQGNGASIVGRFTGDAVLDLVGSQLVTVRDLRIESDSDLQPAFGVLLGRKTTGTSERNYLDNVNIQGWFTQAGLYNYASEIFGANRLTVYQYTQDVPAVFLDNMNTVDVSLYTGATVTQAANTHASMNEGLFTQLDARCVQGSSAGVVKMYSGYLGSSQNIIRRWKFINSYVAQNQGAATRPGFFLSGDIHGLDIDCHCEPFTNSSALYLSHNLLFDAARGAMTIASLKHHDHMSDAQTAVIDANSTANAVSLLNAEIDIPKVRGEYPAATYAKVFGPNCTNTTVHGVLKLGNDQYSNNLSSLADFRGILMSAAGRSTMNLPSASDAIVISSDANAITKRLSELSWTTPDAGTVPVAGSDVVYVSGGTVSSIAGFSDASQTREFLVVNGRGVSITVGGLQGGSVTLAAGKTLKVFQRGSTFFSA